MKADVLTRRTALVLWTLVPIIVVAGVVYGSARGALGAAQELLRQTSMRLAESVDSELNRTVAILRTLAVSGMIERRDLREFHAMATRAVERDPQLENIQLLTSTGEQLVNARVPYGSPLPPLNRPDLPRRAALLREPVVSDVEMGAVAKRLLTAVYVPVIRDDSVALVIVAAIEPPNWAGVLRSNLPPGMEAALLDRASFVITSTLGPEKAGSEPRPADAFPPPSRSGELASDLKRMGAAGGGQYLFSEQVARSSGWRIVTFMQEDDVGALYRHRRLLIVVGLVGLAGYLAVSWVVIQKARRGSPTVA